MRLIGLLLFVASLSECHQFDLSKKTVYAINCGGGRTIGAYGIKYEADYLNAGTPSDHGRHFIFQNANPADIPIYQTERWHMNDFEYKFKLDDGDYVAVLKFSEVYFRNSREKIFNVNINEQAVVKNLDIFHSAGGIGLAYDVYIPFEIRKGELTLLNHIEEFDGELRVAFVKGRVDNPKVNAIAIIRGKLEDMPPVPERLAPVSSGDEDEYEDEEDSYFAHTTSIPEEYIGERPSSQEPQPEEWENYEVPQVAGNPFEEVVKESHFTFIAILATIVVLFPVIYFAMARGDN